MPDVETQTRTNPDTNQGQGNRRRKKGGRNEQNAGDDDQAGGGKKKGKGSKQPNWAERARRVIPERPLLSELEATHKTRQERAVIEEDRRKQNEELRAAQLAEADQVNTWSPAWQSRLEEARAAAEQHFEGAHQYEGLIEQLEKQLQKAEFIQARADIIRQLDVANYEFMQLHARRADIAEQVTRILDERATREDKHQQNEYEVRMLTRKKVDAKKFLEEHPDDAEAKKSYNDLVASLAEKQKAVKTVVDEKKQKSDAIAAKEKEVTDAEHKLKKARDERDASPNDANAVAAFEAAEKDLEAKKEAFGIAEDSADEEQVRLDELDREWRQADASVQRKDMQIMRLQEKYGALSAHIEVDDTPLSDPDVPMPTKSDALIIEGPSTFRKGLSAVKDFTIKDAAQTSRFAGGVIGWAIGGVKDMLSAAKSYVSNPGKVFGGHKHFFGRAKKSEGGGKKK